MECRQKIEKNWRKKKKIKCNHYLIVIIFLFSSCSSNYCGFIRHSLEKQCFEKEQKCSVSFREAFNLEWDKLYIFDSMLYPSEISAALGIDYEGEIVPEGKRLFVFVLMDKVVKDRTLRCVDITFISMKDNGVVRIDKNEVYTMKRINPQDLWIKINN